MRKYRLNKGVNCTEEIYKNYVNVGRENDFWSEETKLFRGRDLVVGNMGHLEWI